MDSTAEHTGMTLGRFVPRVLRTHPFVTAFIACALIGGGFRFAPADTVATPGSNASGPASTACAAS